MARPLAREGRVCAGLHARCAAQPRAFVPQPGRGSALHLADGGQRWGAGQRAALLAALSAGTAAWRCPADRPCLLENAGPTPLGRSSRVVQERPGLLPQARCPRRQGQAGGRGQPGLRQRVGAQPERSTVVVTTSAASLAGAGCWSCAGAGGLGWPGCGRAGPGRGSAGTDSPRVPPHSRCPLLQHPKQQRHAKRALERGPSSPGVRRR